MTRKRKDFWTRETARSLTGYVMLCIGACGLGEPYSATAQERGELPAFRTYGEANPSVVASVNSLISAYKYAWSDQDTAAYVALHAEDTEWINAYARIFQDAASLGEFVGRRLFPAFDASVSREEIENMETVSIRYLGDDAAIVHLYTEGQRGASRDQSGESRRTHIHLVLERQQTAWRIVHTVIMDAR